MRTQPPIFMIFALTTATAALYAQDPSTHRPDGDSAPASVNTVSWRLALPIGNPKGIEACSRVQEHSEQGQESQETTTETDWGVVLDCVKTGAEGGGRVRMTYSFFRTRVTSDQGLTIEFDTRKPGLNAPPEFVLLQLAMGHSIEFDIAADGEVKAVHGVDELVKAVCRFGGVERNPQAEESLRQGLGEKFVHEMLNQWMSIACPRPLSVGEEWTHEVTQQGPVSISENATYRLDRVTPEQIVIVKRADRPAWGPGYRADGTFQGKYVLDRETGLILEADFEQKIDGTIDAGPGQQIRSRVQIETRVRRFVP